MHDECNGGTRHQNNPIFASCGPCNGATRTSHTVECQGPRTSPRFGADKAGISHIRLSGPQTPTDPGPRGGAVFVRNASITIQRPLRERPARSHRPMCPTQSRPNGAASTPTNHRIIQHHCWLQKFGNPWMNQQPACFNSSGPNHQCRRGG